MSWTKEEIDALNNMRVDTELFLGQEDKAYKIVKKTHKTSWGTHEYTDLEKEEMRILPRLTNMNCCGMREIATFPLFPTKEAIKRLSWIISLYRENLYDGYGDDHGICLIATLSEDQSGWWKILKDKGWNEVHSFENANSGNTVKLFTYDVFPE